MVLLIALWAYFGRANRRLRSRGEFGVAPKAGLVIAASYVAMGLTGAMLDGQLVGTGLAILLAFLIRECEQTLRPDSA